MANSQPNSCTLSSDCTIADGLVAKQCYSEVPWSNERNFCECSSWYGYTGEFCDETSVQVIYYRVTLPLFVLASGILMMLLLVDIYVYVRWKKFDNTPRAFSSVLATAVFSFLGVLCLFLHFVLQLGGAFNARSFTFLEFSQYGETVEDVVSDFASLSTAAITFASGLYVVSAIQISLSWIRLSETVSQHFFNKNYAIKTKHLKRFMIFVEVFYLLISALAAVGRFVQPFAFMTPLVGLFLAIFFFIGRKRFMSIIITFRASTIQAKVDAYQGALRLIQLSSRFTIAALLFIVGPLLTFAILLPNWFIHVEPGKFNYVLFLRDIGVIAGLVLFGCNYWFCNQVFNNLISQIKAKMSESQRERAESNWRFSNAISISSRRHLSMADKKIPKKRSSLMSTVESTLTSRERAGSSDETLQPVTPGPSRNRTLSGTEIEKKSLFDRVRQKTKPQFKIMFDADDFNPDSV